MMNVVRAILVMGAGWVIALSPVVAQSEAELLGAASTVQSALSSYRSGDYVNSERLLAAFLKGYGNTSEAKEYLETVYRVLSLSLLQQQKFGEALPNIEKYIEDHPTGEAVQELSYWEGACHYVLQDYGPAYNSLTKFSEKYPQDGKAEQVQTMRGMCQLALEKYAEVVMILTESRQERSAQFQGRVLPVVVFSLLELEQWDRVVEEIQDFDPYAEGMESLSKMNLLCIQAGTSLIELERYRDALFVLQKAWPQQRILARQERRLDELREKLRRTVAKKEANQDEQLELSQWIAEVERDLKRVRSIEGYNTALRYRIARCFYALERYREAYLVFALMVKELPVSDLLMQSNYQMLVSLTRMERWGEAIQSASEFAEKFPDNQLTPNVLYLKAEAMMKVDRFEEASQIFQSIVEEYSKFSEVERCHFLAGYCLLLVERNQDAVAQFTRHLERWPRSGSHQRFYEQAVYWKAMAYYYDKQYEMSREAHAGYLETFSEGQYVIDSEYRKAHALFGQKKFVEAYKELEAFINNYPKTLLADEARNLLGDCYFSMGEIDRGMKAYRTTTTREGRFYDYAQFRVGKALKATEEYEAMRQHFQKFLEERPESSRVTEALSQLAWLHRVQEEPEKARDLYWESIHKYGNDPEAVAVEEMMRTLAKYYRGELWEEYQQKLSTLTADAASQGQVTLASRALWMQVQLLPENDSGARQELLARAVSIAEPRQMSAMVLVDVADSLRFTGKTKQAEAHYWTILSWYPRSLLKDRAYAGLGLLYRDQNQTEKALHYYELFERETVESPLWAEVLQSRASLYQEKGDLSQAVKELERILEIKSARGKPWVEALYQVGEIHLKQKQPKKAIPYFQRIYIMYGRWNDYVAKAYWESGKAFEDMDMHQEALNTYQEFANNTHLKETPEYQRVLDRLEQMGESVKAPEGTKVERAVEGV